MKLLGKPRKSGKRERWTKQKLSEPNLLNALRRGFAP